MPIRESVTRDEYRAAIKPLMDLIGTSDRHVYAHPGIQIVGGKIMVTVTANHEQMPPRADAESPEDQPRPPAVKAQHHFPVVQEGDRGMASELSVAVVIDIEGLDD